MSTLSDEARAALEAGHLAVVDGATSARSRQAQGEERP